MTMIFISVFLLKHSFLSLQVNSLTLPQQFKRLKKLEERRWRKHREADIHRDACAKAPWLEQKEVSDDGESDDETIRVFQTPKFWTEGEDFATEYKKRHGRVIECVDKSRDGPSVLDAVRKKKNILVSEEVNSENEEQKPAVYPSEVTDSKDLYESSRNSKLKTDSTENYGVRLKDPEDKLEKKLSRTNESFLTEASNFDHSTLKKRTSDIAESCEISVNRAENCNGHGFSSQEPRYDRDDHMADRVARSSRSLKETEKPIHEESVKKKENSDLFPQKSKIDWLDYDSDSSAGKKTDHTRRPVIASTGFAMIRKSLKQEQENHQQHHQEQGTLAAGPRSIFTEADFPSLSESSDSEVGKFSPKYPDVYPDRRRERQFESAKRLDMDQMPNQASPMTNRFENLAPSRARGVNHSESPSPKIPVRAGGRAKMRNYFSQNPPPGVANVNNQSSVAADSQLVQQGRRQIGMKDTYSFPSDDELLETPQVIHDEYGRHASGKSVRIKRLVSNDSLS